MLSQNLRFCGMHSTEYVGVLTHAHASTEPCLPAVTDGMANRTGFSTNTGTMAGHVVAVRFSGLALNWNLLLDSCMMVFVFVFIVVKYT